MFGTLLKYQNTLVLLPPLKAPPTALFCAASALEQEGSQKSTSYN